MVGLRIAVNDNIVDVPDSENALHTAQEHIHHPLENSRARSETKRQSAALTLTIWGYKTSFRTTFFLVLYLLEPVAHIHN